MTAETLWELIQAYADATRWRDGQEIDRLEGLIRQSLGELNEPDEAARAAKRMTTGTLEAQFREEVLHIMTAERWTDAQRAADSDLLEAYAEAIRNTEAERWKAHLAAVGIMPPPEAPRR